MRTFLKNITRPLRSVTSLIAENTIDLFPAKRCIKKYNRTDAKYDIKAAISVALLALPQGMAYAAIAGLPIHYGIIAAAVASIVGPLFSSSKYTIQGPSNSTAFMIFSFFAVAHPDLSSNIILYMPILILMVGIILIVGSLLKLADLLQFVSRSVLVGYISGAALLIMMGQMKHIFGVADIVEAKRFFTGLGEIIGAYQHFDLTPILIGAGTLALYLILTKKIPALPNFALCLALSTLTSWILSKNITGYEIDTFAKIEIGSFTPSLPSFNIEHISVLFSLAFAVAFLASLENTVMAKSLGSRTGQRPDQNQDMFSLGMSNIACSMIAPMPSSGSLTRSALNYSAGARTRFASIYSGLLGLIGFACLITFPIVENMPKASLAALVIGIAISLINWKNIRICLHSTSDDTVVVLTTFTATLITRLDVAIFIGVAISITLFLRKASRPHLVEYELSDESGLREMDQKTGRSNPAISIVHVEGNLYFGAADLFRTQIQVTASDPNLKVIILRLKNARHLDATSVMALDDLVKQMQEQNRFVIISGATKSVYAVLKQSGVLETIQEGSDRTKGETNLFFTSPSNPNLSTRDALLRAQDLIGTKDAEIKIFYDSSQATE